MKFYFLTNPNIPEKGLDDLINEQFAPLANAWDALIFAGFSLPNGKNVPFVVALLVLGALFFTLYFSFVNIRKFRLAIKVVKGDYDFLDDETTQNSHELSAVNTTLEGDVVDTIKHESHHGEVNHFQALATAVSGTVGLGNIAGVAIAIALGGPGATFWMIVCGLLGMSSKFVECTLAVKYRDIDSNGVVYGGPMYYLRKGFAENGYAGFGKVLGIIYAILCVGGCFGSGNIFQTNQATQQLATVFNLTGGSDKTLIGCGIALITGLVVIGGIKRIGNFTEKLVPFMAIVYIIAALIIIIYHFDFIDDAFGLIFSKAFDPQAGLGGMVGVLIVGFQRAAYSNEAGMGSASIAHAAVKTKFPASEGLVALLEPFIDTVVICTMTALVIIMYNSQNIFDYGGMAGQVIIKSTGKTASGVDLTSMAFDSVIPHFSYVLTIAIFLFAFSTIISWAYYGMQAWKYLFGKSKFSDFLFKFFFIVFIIIGSAAKLDSAVKFADAMMLAMVFPNMIGLFFLFPKVKIELDRYLKAIKKSEL